MNGTPVESKSPNLREYFKITPSTDSETNADIDAHLTSLTDLRKSLSTDEEEDGLFSIFFEDEGGDKVKFAFIPLSTGADEPVELYYTADGKLETLGKRLHSIYPQSFDIEKVHLDIGKKLIRPIRMSKDDFIARLFAGQLHITPEEISEELKWGGELDGAVADEEELSKPIKALDPAEAPPIEGAKYWERYDPIVKDVALGNLDVIEPPEQEQRVDSTPDGGVTASQSPTHNREQPDNPFDPHRMSRATPSAGDEAESKSSGGQGLFNRDDDEEEDEDDDQPTRDRKVPLEVDNDEVSGTLLVDPAAEAAPHIVETANGKGQVASVSLDGPTLTPDGNGVFARPDVDYTHPEATRWYGQEETIKDWMTTLKTATESNPEYESGTNEGDVVVVLDEIDILGADNDKLLYEFPRARKMGSLENTRVGVIGISNNHMFKDSLDPRVKSTLCEYEIFFSPYDATELTDILQHYADLVFRDGIIDEGVIQLCAARAAQEQGDAREALDLLETAGNIARKHDAGQVTKSHVEEAGSRVEEQRVLTIVREQLTSQMKLALLATAFLNIDDEASPRAKKIYQVYENICEVCGYEPRSKRRVNDFLDSIRLYDLLERDERNLGRAGGRSYIHTLEVSPELVFEGLKQDQDGSESTLERYDLVPDPDEAQQARLMSYV